MEFDPPLTLFEIVSRDIEDRDPPAKGNRPIIVLSLCFLPLAAFIADSYIHLWLESMLVYLDRRIARPVRTFDIPFELQRRNR